MIENVPINPPSWSAEIPPKTSQESSTNAQLKYTPYRVPASSQIIQIQLLGQTLQTEKARLLNLKPTQKVKEDGASPAHHDITLPEVKNRP